ncbi:MAG TPA: right-handed parallel beta-helix repeat-containing protein, partial [bacterium]|nr:right-handed parallel beta-helix repeat-containing protein [bacterium]
IREFKQEGPLPEKGITVYIREGFYPFTETFKLTEDDSGTESAPIIWRSYPGEEVHFIGGKVLTRFEPVNDPAILKRIDTVYHDKILQTDLRAQGITDYGEIFPGNKRAELYFKNKYMALARYPNEGWMTVSEVPLTPGTIFKGDPRTEKADGSTRGQHSGKLRVDDDRLTKWDESSYEEMWMFGYWFWDWSEKYSKVDKIDKTKKEVYIKEPFHFYGYRKGQRFYFLNILEELDAPGEYYIDRRNGKLYFWPPEPIREGDVTFPVLQELMVSLEGTSYTTIRGIIFECSRTSAVKIEGGTHNVFAGCIVRNIGEDAVIIKDGTENGIVSCDIYEVSAAGATIHGGDRKTLTPANNYGINNHVHHYSQVFRTYRSAISLSGVGNRIANNYIHDAPHEGVRFHGNEHVMEFNEIHHVAMETGDVPAIGSDVDWTYRGNIIRHNYFHHIHGPGHLGCMTIYLDLPVGGTWIYGNIIYDADWGFYTNSGRDITIENNIFIKCNPAMGFGTWGDPKMFQSGGDWRIYERLMEMNYKEPPYSTRYPELLKIFKDGDPSIPHGNLITKNISMGGTFFQFRTADLNFEILTIVNNLIADPVILEWRQKNHELKPFTIDDSEIVKTFEDYGNIVINSDPGFVDIEHEDFRLKEDSPAWKLGFKPIPFDKIGLYIDEYRTSLPDE